jgi:hypothetical protein
MRRIGFPRGVRSLQKKLEKSFVTRGVLGTLQFGLRHTARVIIRAASPAARRARLQERAVDEAFDRRFGVDTGGVIPLSDLDVASDTWMYGSEYQAVGSGVDFGAILHQLGAACEDFTFVDLGSGKGRAVLLASTVPFQRVIGVEFSRQLHAVAEQNVARWPADARKSGPIELVCIDATEFEYPESPFVLFMYNPFGRPVMEKVAHAVARAFERRPRRIIVLYFTPRQADIWDRLPFLARVLVRPGLHAYDSGAALSLGVETGSRDPRV